VFCFAFVHVHVLAFLRVKSIVYAWYMLTWKAVEGVCLHGFWYWLHGVYELLHTFDYPYPFFDLHAR
jgi:hypothetical protein